jgi:predicted transglutaminase-like cysteine proteinase
MTIKHLGQYHQCSDRWLKRTVKSKLPPLPRFAAFAVPVLLFLMFSSSSAADAAMELVVREPGALERIEREYGHDARLRMQRLGEIIDEGSRLATAEKLSTVNNFFNLFRFVSDEEQWGVEDYWASPREFISQNAGDCEDFALAKYFSLLAVGVPEERLRMTYVNALDLGQAHMVLTYYPTPASEPLVLDNLTPDILPASKRSDLRPVYSFNGVGLWLAKERGKGRFAGSASQLKRWVELNKKMARDGGQP